MEIENVLTLEGFKSALLALRDRSKFRHTKYLEILRAQYKSAGHSTTATNLANALGYENYNSANLHYGTLAHLVTDELGFQPEKRSNGEYMWWQTLLVGNPASDDTTE